MAKRTTSYHSWLLGQLGDPQVAAEYVNEAIQDSPELLPKVLRNVAEARTMRKVADAADVNRETLYRTLSEEGNPTWNTLNAILRALDLRFLVASEKSVVARESGSLIQDGKSQTTTFTKSGGYSTTLTASTVSGTSFTIGAGATAYATSIPTPTHITLDPILSAKNTSGIAMIGS